MKTIFENNGGSYTQQGNYLLPNLTLSDGIQWILYGYAAGMNDRAH